MIIDIIYGPPGCGKTTTLMDILEKELANCKPSEIAFVTFTKEGALQGIRRACERFGYTQKEFIYFRTLHSLAFNELKLSRANVMGPKQFKHFSQKLGMNFVGYYNEDFTNDDDKYLFFDHLQRNNPKYAAKQVDSYDIKTLEFVRRNYKKYKDFYALYDYTDMLEMYNKSNKEVPVKVVIVDEAQDLTTLQWETVWRAFRNVEKVYISGDDDQAIYQWSGADVDYFLGINGNTKILQHSYRLPDVLVDYAKRISKQITKRVDKVYNGTGKEGSVTEHNSVEEIAINPEEKYMFLSRNNCYLKDVEEYIRDKGLMYSVKGKASATKQDVAAINYYEKLRQTRIMSANEELSLLPYLKKQYSLNDPWYESFIWNESKCNYFRDLIKNKTDISKVNINIGTIHSVKGGETDNVVMLLDVTKAVKDNIDNNPDSEHRVFYVGATRAKKSLSIINSNSKFGYTIY